MTSTPTALRTLRHYGHSARALSLALGLRRMRIFKLLVTLCALLAWVVALGAASAQLTHNIYHHWQLDKRSSLMIYLPPDTDPTALNQLVATLPTLAGVDNVAVVPPTTLQGWLAPVISNTAALPLPTVVQLSVAGDAPRNAVRATLAQGFPTAELDDHAPVLQDVGRIIEALQRGAAILGLVMLAILALIIGLTVRVGLLARQHAIQLLIQLGATDASLALALLRSVVGHVCLGTLVGTLAAAALLAAASATTPVLASHMAANVWLALLCAPLLLPALAAAVTALTALGMIRRV